MAIEPRRGCGYRKVGGTYLVSGPGGIPCDRLPIPLTVCPTCNAGFKQTRGWTWIDVAKLVEGEHEDCDDSKFCRLCKNPEALAKAGLLWIGEQFYPNVKDFTNEALELGVSRRIRTVPRGFKVGETYVLLAHPKAVHSWEDDHLAWTPGIFRLWLPTRIEKLVFESQRDSDEVKELIERGISPVFIPDNDRDHQGSVYDEPSPELEFAAEV